MSAWFRDPNQADINIRRCDDFEELLKGFKINFDRHSTYHFQIQRQHNFYPTKKTYYNSESNKKFRYPEFKSNNDVLKFLGKNVK